MGNTPLACAAAHGSLTATAATATHGIFHRNLFLPNNGDFKNHHYLFANEKSLSEMKSRKAFLILL
ncbi:MAG: hypothetical protein H6577_02435 [Lewinellaceae bacterium]|nr:hypothetical protein [Saprospiraceae bacterium]MCB9336966.1 hypothetical protein [Lewinellaceae bacterium]